MPSFESVLVLTTLVSSALAAPAPAQLVPRSFEVLQARNENAPPRNGLAAMAKAFNKYGWPMPDAVKTGMAKASVLGAGAGAGAGAVDQAANGTTGGDDGSVNTASANMGAEFLSPVTIGGQKFNMDFDTGSSDL